MRARAEVSTERPDDPDLVGRDFAALFDRHGPAVHRYLSRRLGRTVADDLLGQTFLIAYERRASYDRTRSDARPWLYGIATNLLRRHQRDEVRQYRAWARTGVDPLLTEGHADQVVDRVDAGARSAQLAAALATLAAADRDVLLLYAWCELSYPEIADALDVPIGTVRSRLHRARTVLRTALAPTLTAAATTSTATTSAATKENDHG